MNLIEKPLLNIQASLNNIDRYRDRVLFVFIKPYWPRFISPNHLTLARVAIGLALFVLLFYYKNNNTVLLLSLFSIGIVTDLLDGSVARGLNKETNVGVILDPAADRILIIPIAFYSLFFGHQWLLLLLILLEVISGLLSLVAQRKGVFMPSNIFGKVKMFLQSIVFLAILYFWPKAPNMFFIYLLWGSLIVMVASIYVKIFEIRSIKPRHAS